jgi:hypothetical protein
MINLIVCVLKIRSMQKSMPQLNMKYFVLTLLFALALTLPLGGLELLTGGRVALFSSYVRPRVARFCNWIWGYIPPPLRGVILVVWSVLSFVMVGPFFLLFNYLFLWGHLISVSLRDETEFTTVELKPASVQRQNIKDGPFPIPARPKGLHGLPVSTPSSFKFWKKEDQTAPQVVGEEVFDAGHESDEETVRP